MAKKRIMALDVGDKRIGIAITDPTATVITPLMTYKRKEPEKDADFIASLYKQKDVGILVIGLPVLPSGKEGTQAGKVREFVRRLEKRGMRVEFWDESFSTDRAMEFLRGKTPREKREKRDALAAAIILEEYLREKIEKIS